MRFITIVGLLLILFVGSAYAQDSVKCAQIAEEALILLEDIRTAIEANDIDSALTSINTVQEKLVNCNQDVEETNGNAANASNNETIDTTTGDTENELTGNFIVNAPEINPENSISFVQFSNWSPDIGNLDFYLDNNSLPIVENIAYQDVTNLIVVNGGNLSVTVRPAGSGSEGTILSLLNWNFQGNSSWVVSGIGLQSETAFFIEPISIIRNNYDDKARVRVINLIAAHQNVTVNTNSDVTLANGIGWVGIKDTMLDAGTYTLDAELEGNTQIDNLISENFEANNTYTIILTGMNTDEQPIQADMIRTSENITRVKFISNRSEAVEIFIMPNGIEVVDQLEPDTETDWIPLPSGALSFILYAPDSGPTSQELAGISRQLRPGRDITIVIDDNGLNISEQALTP